MASGSLWLRKVVVSGFVDVNMNDRVPDFDVVDIPLAAKQRDHVKVNVEAIGGKERLRIPNLCLDSYTIECDGKIVKIQREITHLDARIQDRAGSLLDEREYVVVDLGAMQRDDDSNYEK